MGYSKQLWANLLAGGTKLNATRLQHMEDGIEAAASVADAALSAAGSGATGAPFTVYVAAANAPAAEKALAGPTFTCDGVADDVQIQAAIALVQAVSGGVPTRGGRVLLSPGTFVLAATVTIDGGGDVDLEHDVFLDGAGPSETVLDARPGALLSGVHLTGSCKAHLARFRVLVDGATHGISSAGELTADAGYRSFWHSTIRDISVVGDFSAHTGWAYHLGSPFRSVLENLEGVGVGNGMRMFSEDPGFNPGDCVVSRCFMDIVGTNHRAYSIESPVAVGNMNQVEFVMCEAIASGTGCTGLFMGGTGPVNMMKWRGINLEQFDTLVDFDRGYGNRVDLNYVELRSGAAANTTRLVRFGANAVQNSVDHVGFFYTAGTVRLIEATGTDTTLPNLVERVLVFDDTGAVVTNNITTAATVIRKWTTSWGPGNATGVVVTPA